ncbi:MAG: DinB family protein [Cyclobacteriaceae bacterium]
MDKDLLHKFTALEGQRYKLLEFFDQWGAHQLHFKPGSEQWSLLQVLDHIVKVDISITKYLQKYQSEISREKLGFIAWWRALFLKLFLLTPLRVKAPKVHGIQPEESVDVPSLVADWCESRSLLKDYLEVFPMDKLDNFIFKHPLSGKLNVVQTLMFVYYHTKHHEHQLKRITSHSKFPGGTPQ